MKTTDKIDARCGPACRVVWQGTRRINLRAPMPISIPKRKHNCLSLFREGSVPSGELFSLSDVVATAKETNHG
jgi:hypothetical protein